MSSDYLQVGRLLQTRTVADVSKANPVFAREVLDSIHKFRSYEWGDTCPEDARLNDRAVRRKDDRLLAKYRTVEGNLFITMDDWEERIVTVLFASEY